MRGVSKDSQTEGGVVRGLKMLALKIKEGEDKSEDVGLLLKAGKSIEVIIPILLWSLQKEYSPADPFLNFDLKNCGIITLYRFKSLSLW